MHPRRPTNQPHRPHAGHKESPTVSKSSANRPHRSHVMSFPSHRYVVLSFPFFSKYSKMCIITTRASLRLPCYSWNTEPPTINISATSSKQLKQRIPDDQIGRIGRIPRKLLCILRRSTCFFVRSLFGPSWFQIGRIGPSSFHDQFANVWFKLWWYSNYCESALSNLRFDGWVGIIIVQWGWSLVHHS